MSLTLLMFVISCPLNLIQDLRKFKWVNMAALFSLMLLLLISAYILLFKDLTSYPLIYESDKVNLNRYRCSD